MKKILKLCASSFSKKFSQIDPRSLVFELKFFKLLIKLIFKDFRKEVFPPLLFFILILLSQIILIKKLFFLLFGILVLVLAFQFTFGVRKYFWCALILVFSLLNTQFKLQKVDYFNEVVSKDIELYDEYYFSSRAIGQIRASSNGTFAMILKIDSKRMESGTRVKLIFTERTNWDEFPESCFNGFSCSINDGHFSTNRKFDFLDYAELFANGIVGNIPLFNEKDPNAPCRCLGSKPFVEVQSQFETQKQSLLDKLLLLQEDEPDEEIRLGISILMGTVLGQSKQIPQWTRDLFKETGLYHLLVISGFHLGVIIYLLKKITLLCFKNIPSVYKIVPIIKLQTFLAAFLLILFVTKIDSGLPVWRALISFLIILFFLMIDRKIPKARLLLLSLIVVEALWPLSVMLVSVQLTFAALAGIFFGSYLAERYKKYRESENLNLWEMEKPNSSFQGIVSFLFPSLFAFIFISPIQYFWFGTFSIYALLFNLLFAFSFGITVVGVGFISILALYLNLPGALFLIKFQALISSYIIWMIFYLDQFLGI